MKKISGILFIVIGLVFVFNSQILNLIVKTNSKRTLKEFKTIEIEENIGREDISYDFSEIDNIDPSKTYLDLSERDKKDIIGQLVIPATETNVTIFEGISKEKLWKGVSTMKKGQKMGEGNFSLAGHYGIKGELFHNIKDLEPGDEIRLTNKDKLYLYRVYSKEIVSPVEVHMISDEKSDNQGAPIISLMSCYYEDGKNTGQRIFVIGELEEIIDYEEEKMESKNLILRTI